jgi:hypothetical protein
MDKKIPILVIEHPYERAALSLLLGVLGVLVCAYLYFVGASVLNIMARKEAGADLERTRTSIAQMEEQYFALSKSITSESARTLGLAPVSETSYVYRPGNAAVVRPSAQNDI